MMWYDIGVPEKRKNPGFEELNFFFDLKEYPSHFLFEFISN